MKYLKKFNESAGFSTDEKTILEWCRRWNIAESTVTIVEGGFVNVNGDVWIKNGRMSGISGRLPIRFGEVTGDFEMNFQDLTSLEGSPRSVGGSFDVSANKLENLIGGPTSVGDTYECRSNEITSLVGCPGYVKALLCGRNKLQNLIGCPEASLICCDDNNLTSLEGCPRVIAKHPDGLFSGGLHIDKNKSLKNLIGGPERVEGDYFAHYCDLESVEGVAKEIYGTLHLSDNYNLWDLRGLKDSKIGSIRFSRKGEIPGFTGDQPCKRLIRLFPEMEEFIESLDYNYIRSWEGKPAVVKFRLEEAQCEILGKEVTYTPFNLWNILEKQYIILDENLEPYS